MKSNAFYDMKELIDFFKALAANNNREWFAQNKEWWERVRKNGMDFASQMIEAVAKVDPRAAYFTPNDCTYRINRDTRFSPDKTPYKTHFGIFINPPLGKKAITSGYYFHIEPGNCGFYAGTYGLPSPMVRAIRQSIYDEIDEWRSIVENARFKRLLPHLGEDYLKTAPKGFDKSWPYLDYVRPREFCAYNNNMESIFLSGDVASKIAPYIEEAFKFNRFINYAIEQFPMLRPTPERRK